MLRLPTPRFIAALSLCFAAALPAAPASAFILPSEATTAATIRSINPALPVAKARAYARSVIADANRSRLDPKVIMSIVTVESRWRAGAVSGVGALGLGQLMPGTAAQLGVNPKNPADNLRGTSTYLKSLLNHFAGKRNALTLAVASYNAGPGAVEQYHGIPPYPETRDYVRKVLVTMHTLDTRLAIRATRDAARVAARGAAHPPPPRAGKKKTLAAADFWPLIRLLDFQPLFLS